MSLATRAKRIIWPFSGIVGLICGMVSAAPVLVFGLAAPGYLILPLLLGVGGLVTMLVVYWSQVLFSPEGTGELPTVVTAVGMAIGLVAIFLFVLLEFEPAIPLSNVIMFLLSVTVVGLFVVLLARFWRNIDTFPGPAVQIGGSVVATLVLALVAWLLLVGSVYGLIDLPIDGVIASDGDRILPISEVCIALGVVLFGWHYYRRSKLGLDAAVTLLLVGITPLAVVGVASGFCTTVIRCVA